MADVMNEAQEPEPREAERRAPRPKWTRQLEIISSARDSRHLSGSVMSAPHVIASRSLFPDSERKNARHLFVFWVLTTRFTSLTLLILVSLYARSHTRYVIGWSPTG